MKFLVIGASGFVGGHTIRYLKSKGHDVTGTQFKKNQSGLLSFNLETDRIQEILPPDFFNTGGPVYAVVTAVIGDIERCAREPQMTRRVNVDGTIRLIDDLGAAGATVVYLSSSWVFDGIQGDYADDAPHRPLSEYAKHKSEVEMHARARVKGAIVLRLDKIVGDQPQEHHLFSEWHKWIESGKPLTCIRGQRMSPTFVDDVTRAVEESCRLRLTGVRNVANPESFSREDLARAFLSALNRKGSVELKSQEEIGLVGQRPMKSFLNPAAFIKDTGLTFTPMKTVLESFSKKIQKSAVK